MDKNSRACPSVEFFFFPESSRQIIDSSLLPNGLTVECDPNKFVKQKRSLMSPSAMRKLNVSPAINRILCFITINGQFQQNFVAPFQTMWKYSGWRILASKFSNIVACTWMNHFKRISEQWPRDHVVYLYWVNKPPKLKRTIVLNLSAFSISFRQGLVIIKQYQWQEPFAFTAVRTVILSDTVACNVKLIYPSGNDYSISLTTPSV